MEDSPCRLSNRSRRMIGERRVAPSREQSWQPTFQSPSAYSFRYVTVLVSPARVSGELRVLVKRFPGNGERSYRSAMREVETRRRPHHHRSNYTGGPRACFEGIMAATLLRQPLDVRQPPSVLPSTWSAILFLSPPTLSLARKCYCMLQSCTGPNFVLPHLYPHNPAHQRGRSYILYRPTLSFLGSKTR